MSLLSGYVGVDMSKDQSVGESGLEARYLEDLKLVASK